jgi:hypothetical protein
MESEQPEIRRRVVAAARDRGWTGQETSDEVSGLVCDGCYQWRAEPEFALYDIWHLCVACTVAYETGLAEGRYRQPTDYFADTLLPGEFADGFEL